MLDFTWKFFSKTGSIETYLLLKEMEKNVEDEMQQHEEIQVELDSPIS
ncbi:MULTISPECIES: YqzL family protein [unclassified Bacillus (in: firmicutes)]|nr:MULTISPECIES: YqzL family protein [unclassified Bacillus (in: firmicutes)]MDC2863369.1 YqzL family protein [Bacillus sp. BP-3]